MTYEVGKWQGWNGGECPVHPKTEVEYKCALGGGESVDGASDLRWDHTGSGGDIIAFRVINEHKEPREFWVCYGEAFDSMSEAMEYGLDEDEIIHVKEVV